jgi:hypothetical protein
MLAAKIRLIASPAVLCHFGWLVMMTSCKMRREMIAEGGC